MAPLALPVLFYLYFLALARASSHTATSASPVPCCHNEWFDGPMLLDNSLSLHSETCCASINACHTCGGVVCPTSTSKYGTGQKSRKLQVDNDKLTGLRRLNLLAAAVVIAVGVLGVAFMTYLECPPLKCRRPFQRTSRDEYIDIGERFESWELEIDRDVLLL
jgi:hypothetical protein